MKKSSAYFAAACFLTGPSFGQSVEDWNGFLNVLSSGGISTSEQPSIDDYVFFQNSQGLSGSTVSPDAAAWPEMKGWSLRYCEDCFPGGDPVIGVPIIFPLTPEKSKCYKLSDGKVVCF